MSRRADDAGFSTVMGAGLMMVVLAVAAAAVSLAAIGVTRHRAEAAADLAALAAADRVLEGNDTACKAAEDIVRDQGAVLQSCAVEGLDVVVTVALRPGGPLGALGQVRGRARAGFG